MLKDDNAGNCSSDVDESISSSNSSALQSFFADLMAGDMDRHVSSSSSASLSTSFCIIDDRATSLNRSASHSFQKAERNMLRRCRRRRTRAIDTNSISRWESYPHEKEACVCNTVKIKPERRMSPRPTSLVEDDVCQHQFQARIAAHNAVTNTAAVAPMDEKVGKAFTPCSSWLDVVAQHGSFSPKPVSKKTLAVKRAASVPPAERKRSESGAARAPARIIRKSSGDSHSLAATLKAERAERAARLCGAPRRPHRQASLTDVTRHMLRHAAEAGSDHSTQMINKHLSDDDCSEESFQDAASAEWKEICARTA